MGKTELIGGVAGILTTIGYIPQVIKIWKSKDVEAISLPMYIILCLGVFLWIIYGISIRSTSLFAANFITLILTSSVLTLKIFHEKAKSKK